MPAAVAVPLIVGGMSTGAAVYGATRQSSAAQRAAALQTSAANHAADLEAKTAGEQLTFAKDQEARRQLEFERVQKLNQDNYLSDVARDDERYGARQGRLRPYIDAGYGSLGQLMRPMGAGAGTLGSRMGG